MPCFPFRLSLATLLAGAGLLTFLSPGLAQKPQRTWADTSLAKTLIEESRKMNREEKSDIALAKAQEALSINSDLYGENHVITAKTRLFVAREIRELKRDEEAIAFMEQSLHVFETARDTPQMAITHNLLSSCRRNQKQFAEARRHIEMSIRLMRPDSARNRTLMADFKTTLGYIYNEEKNYPAAIRVLEQAKAVQTFKKNAEALGLIYYHIGNAYFGLHDYVRAKEEYLTSSAYLQGQRMPAHSYFADLEVNVGLCFQKTGDSETGLAHLLKARDVYLKFGLTDIRYINFLQILGQFYLDERQYADAITQFETCLAVKEKLFGVQSPYLLGILRSLAKARTETGQFVQAENYYQQALRIARTLPGGGVNFSYSIYRDLAALHLAQGDYTGSLQRCDTAFAIAGFDAAHPEKMTPRDAFRELAQTYAQALVLQYRQTADIALLLRADQYFTLAAQTLYREIAEVTVNSSREIFYDRDHLVLEQWLDTRMLLFEVTGNPEYAEAAFQIAGHGKAFLLAEAMRGSGALRYAGVPDSVLQAEWTLRTRISSAEKKLDEIDLVPTKDSAHTIQSLSRDLSGWRAEYDALLHRIEQAYPEYFRLRLLQQNISSLDLRKKWLAPNQSLLMYSLTETHAYAFVLTRDTFCVVVLPSNDHLAIEVATMRKSLTGYYAADEPDDALYDRALDAYIEAAQSLYQKLALPVAHLLSSRVVVIPEGILCYLPFEALLTSAPTDAGNFRTYPFWMRKKSLSYALSTENMVAMNQPPPVKFRKNWLGVAPFGDVATNDSIASKSGRNESFLPLPFSGKEVSTIANLVQGETWLDAAALPGRFEKEAAQYRILHLATHSRVNDQSGQYSYIATSNLGQPLYAKDLYLLTLAAEMAVLSSCEAGGGKLLRGEGIIGMVRAFTYAGARSVVAPLWVANDRSTADLLVDFYRNLRKGQPKDVALQGARIKMLDKSPDAAHPFFWSGFRVYGQVVPLWK